MCIYIICINRERRNIFFTDIKTLRCPRSTLLFRFENIPFPNKSLGFHHAIGWTFQSFFLTFYTNVEYFACCRWCFPNDLFNFNKNSHLNYVDWYLCYKNYRHTAHPIKYAPQETYYVIKTQFVRRTAFSRKIYVFNYVVWILEHCFVCYDFITMTS